MYSGNYKTAFQNAHKLIKFLDHDIMHDKVLKYYMNPLFSVLLHVLIRFGKWEEILQDPY